MPDGEPPTRMSPALLRRGSDAPTPERRTLRAGGVEVLFEDGGLRSVGENFHEGPALRAVYVAVRDRNWGTVPGVLSERRVEDGGNTFRITFLSEHRQREIDFAWRGEITGGADGSVTFTMDGEARSTFLRNRIGFCVLHPLDVLEKSVRIEHSDGSEEEGVFPRFIAPHQPFTDIRALTHGIGYKSRLRLCLRFAGEVFEMEDQRNWTDSSFKTYCTPLARPFPVLVEQGTRIRQSVALTWSKPLSVAGEPTPPFRQFSFAPHALATHRQPPRLGLGLASHGQPLSAREIERLRALYPAHLRADLRLWEDGWRETLARAARECAAVGARLEGALFLTDDAEAQLRALAREVERLGVPVARWLVFHRDAKTTPYATARLARAILREGAARAPIVGGTNAYFAELNRARPALGLGPLDAVCWSVNPQVHAFDDESLLDTQDGQRWTVLSARKYFRGCKRVVSPVTLKPRFNPDATGPPLPPAPGELPPDVDPRQAALFGAVWTLQSLAAMVGSRASSVTFYETTGWRGVMETEAGPPLPDRFPSLPGAVFPLYHVLADVGEFAEGRAAAHFSYRSLVGGLLLWRRGRRRALIANASLAPRTVEVNSFWGREGVPPCRVKLLDETTVERAMAEPEAWRAEPGERLEPGLRNPWKSTQVLHLRLLPYAIARLDAEEE